MTADGVPPIDVIGIGEDGTAGLTAAALERLRAAEVLVGGRRHLALVPEHAAERIVLKGGLDATLAALDTARRAGRRIVVLASGDPCLHGIAPRLAARYGREAVRVLPAPSSVALAFARLGLGWQDARILSAHGRPIRDCMAAAQGATKLAVLTDETNTPQAVAGALLEAGIEDAPAHVFERLGGPAERHVETALTALARWPERFDPLNLVVVLRRWPPRRRLAPGRPDTAYAHRAGQITKAEVRAVSLAKLAPGEGDTVWDVGAGSGSVAIEAAALVGERGAVWAVERDPEQRQYLAQNLARFPSPNLHVVAGEAPAALHRLPTPDAVFVGGTGGRLDAILATVAARLRPGGTLVLNLATLEHLATTLTALREAWTVEVTQVSVSRGSDVAGLTRLAALNPVFVVRAERPEGAG